MARRTPQEINAGSMADMAFLLLIFFLVTTTMEVDAGIGRNMPLKVDHPIEDVPVHERDILRIKANFNDELRVDDESIKLDELEEIVTDFYSINIKGDVDPTLPAYTQITSAMCMTKISEINQKILESPDNGWLKDELTKWETKLEICNDLGGEYQELAPMAIIRLEYQAGTSYGLYIQIQNTLKKVVNQLRQEKCKAYYNKDYYTLDPTVQEDILIIEKIRILVPEIIIDAPIQL